MHYIKFIAITIVLAIGLSACTDTEQLEKHKLALGVIETVENFKKENHRLPANYQEINLTVTEGGPVFYEKRDEGRYEVSYCIGSAVDYTYHSDSREWTKSGYHGL